MNCYFEEAPRPWFKELVKNQKSQLLRRVVLLVSWTMNACAIKPPWMNMIVPVFFSGNRWLIKTFDKKCINNGGSLSSTSHYKTTHGSLSSTSHYKTTHMIMYLQDWTTQVLAWPRRVAIYRNDHLTRSCLRAYIVFRVTNTCIRHLCVPGDSSTP
jgi:hypothetical protein